MTDSQRLARAAFLSGYMTSATRRAADRMADALGALERGDHDLACAILSHGVASAHAAIVDGPTQADRAAEVAS